MGCGSSSTAVQTFKNPEENKNYQKPSRQASAAPSIKSQRSEKNEKPSRKSSASSRASVASTDSRRANSASTRKTYTIQRPNSEVVTDSTLVTPRELHDDNEYKHETDVVNFEPVDEIDEKKLEAQRHHEEIQKQTFLTGDPDHEVHPENVTENHLVYKAEHHEEIAKRKEEKRSQLNYEDIEEETINSFGPVSLSFPSDMDEAGEVNAEYTVDDIVEHNNEVSEVDWFKYGKKIYSWKKMEPIIKDRINQFKDPDAVDYDLSHLTPSDYPIYIARNHKVSRKELKKVLPFCHVGNSIEVPHEQKLSRMKQSAENVLEDEGESEYLRDYKNQLNRWLADYPMNKIANDPPDAEADPNELPFPLPADIKSDPTVLRKWSEAWEVFDCQVPEEGAWVMADPPSESLGDTHEMFSNAVKECHGIEALEPFEMTIDGDVAWVVIELDLFKNDQTTENQDTVWKKRATRTNLNDPIWMKKRREELGSILKMRYEKRQIDYPVENFINFADVLEQHWEEFQSLCAKEFNPPVRKARQTAEIKPVNEDKSHIEEMNGHNDHEETIIELESTDKGTAENNLRSESRGSNDSTYKRDTPRESVKSGGGSRSSNRGGSSGSSRSSKRDGSPDNKERLASRESNQSLKSSLTSKRDSPENVVRPGSKGSDRGSVRRDSFANSGRPGSRESKRRGSFDRDSYGNSIRTGSGGSNHTSYEGGSEQGPNTEDKQGVTAENSERLAEDNDNVVGDQDQMPVLETNDSGLDLISNDQIDVGNADSEKKDGDSLQMPDKQENDGGPTISKKETDDDFFD